MNELNPLVIIEKASDLEAFFISKNNASPAHRFETYFYKEKLQVCFFVA
jgi:hypothetical protein